MLLDMVRHAAAQWFGLAPLTLLVFCNVNGAVPPAAEPTSPAATNAVAIPFEFVSGRILVASRVNDAQPASVMLDTGYSINMLSRELVESLELKRVGRITVVGVAGEERADVFEGVKFDLAGATYSPRRVGALPASYQSHWRKRDGVLGEGVFKRFVIEVDPKAKEIRLREPDTFRYSGDGEVIPLKFKQTTPIAEGAVIMPDRDPVLGRFEIDTGCDGGLCLGSDFVEANRLLGSTGKTESSGRRGLGGGARTRIGHVPKFRLGSQVIERPLTNFFLEGSPVDDGLAGHIGMEVLRRFKVIFDYPRERMILEPLE